MLGWNSAKSGMPRTLALWFAFLGCAGCSTLWLSPRNAQIKAELNRAEYSASSGNYRAAIQGYEQALEKSPQNPWRDRVLYELGCLYALPENPDKDFARSLYCFQRLKDEFPKNRFKMEAQVWLGLLEKLISLAADLEAREAEFAIEKSALEKEIAGLKTERLAVESSWTAEINLKAGKLKELENLIQTQKTAIENLQQQLKKIKEIDIQSEKKATGIK